MFFRFIQTFRKEIYVTWEWTCWTYMINAVIWNSRHCLADRFTPGFSRERIAHIRALYRRSVCYRCVRAMQRRWTPFNRLTTKKPTSVSRAFHSRYLADGIPARRRLTGVMMLFSCSSNSVPAQKGGPHGSYMSVPLRIPASLDSSTLFPSVPRTRAFRILRRAVTAVTHLDAICDEIRGREETGLFLCIFAWIR